MPDTANKTTNNGDKDQQSRIIYVEPNDSAGHINGVPVTPDYTDFCISFDLVVEVVSRMRASSISGEQKEQDIDEDGNVKDTTKSYIVSWTSKYDPNPDSNNKDKKPDWVSFMVGEDYGDRNYLTTYYTDNHYNDFTKREILEGIGVESVNITFESYYTPTIKIRFIDVRGASIFGREEKLHVDEVLAEDNIWGCFFTFPYPKYKLQVKGFYGKAVTFQLCCTDFRGHFNSLTGNFEIDMTFLGYDFGLIADVPMQYLIAAPYCNYGGASAFWEKQRMSNPDWRMSNGGYAEKLYAIRLKIAEILNKYGNGNTSDVTVTTEEIEAVDDPEKKELLDRMKSSVDYLYDTFHMNDLDEFIKTLRQGAKGVLKKQADKQLNEIAKHLTIIFRSLEEFMEKYPDDILSTLDFHKNIENIFFPKNAENTIYRWGLDVYKQMQVRLKGPYASGSGAYSVLSEENPLSWEIVKERTNKSGWAAEIVEHIIHPIKEFCDEFNKLYNTQTHKEEIEVSPPSYSNTSSIIGKNIEELVGFLPNIGNTFRLVFCHLETFNHMLYRCRHNIVAQMQSKQRTLKKLGLTSLENTNLHLQKGEQESDIQLPPFPAVYTYKEIKADESAGQEEDDQVTIQAWPGDFRKKSEQWEEEMLVEDLFQAVLHSMGNSGDNSPAIYKSTNFPILPCDLNHGKMAPIGLADSPAELAGYLGLRAAAIFGIANMSSNDNDAKAIGKAEAIQFFETYGSKDALKQKILDKLGNGDEANYLSNITLCKDENKDPQYADAFEVSTNLALVPKGKEKRQPIFVSKGEKLNYAYTTDEKGNGYLPIRLASWKELNKDNGEFSTLKYEGGKPSKYSIGIINNKGSVLYRLNTKTALKDEESEDILKNYTNDEMFTLYYGGDYGNGQAVVTRVEELYDKLKDGSVTLNGYTAKSDERRFACLLSNWKNVTRDSFRSTYFTSMSALSPSLDKLGFKDGDGIDKNGKFCISAKQENSDNFYGKQISNTAEVKEYQDLYLSNFRGEYVGYANNSFNYNNTNIDESETFVLSPCLRQYDGSREYLANVFTTEIFYLQNQYEFLNHGEPAPSESGYSAVSGHIYVKAMLFLMSLATGNLLKKSHFFKNNVGIIEGVPLVEVLFLGSLLWRKRFYEETGFDPINYRLFNDAQDKKNQPGELIIKEVKQEEIPAIYKGDIITPCFLYTNATGNYVKLSSLANIQDEVIKNVLIQKFEDFVKGQTWQTIMANCELKTKNGSEMKSTNDIRNLFKGVTTQNCIDFPNTIANICGTAQYAKKYFYLLPSLKTTGIVYSILRPENPALEVMKELYLSEVILQKSVGSFNNKGLITINSSTYSAYLNGFIGQLREICTYEGEAVQEEKEITQEEKDNNDIKRLIYMFLKNLWDRWYVNNNESDFTTKTMMEKTIFIDSMYRNVYTNIHINCEILESLISEGDGKSMVFKFLSDLTTKHHCMFFALPDSIGLESRDRQTFEESLKEMFTPIPYVKKGKIKPSNKFIVMFTHKPSEIGETMNNYKYDSFDIYSHDGDESNILPTFAIPVDKNMGDNSSDFDWQCTRYGYYMPSFGVEYARQANAIFKNIDIGMQNPVQTEQAIDALSLIASRGRGAGERTIFYGQDLYPVFSGYSYTATIEMMGNMQIMPLMYFQLFNVPMFRGAYMIYGVSHSIKPGNMTTTVKAMKMSKRTLPWCQEWYAHYYFDAEGNVRKVGDDECGTAINVPITIDYANDVVFKVIRNKFGRNYTNGEFYVNDKLLCYTLERYDLGVDNSEPNITTTIKSKKQTNGGICIQSGIYEVFYFYRGDEKHKYYCGRLKNVNGWEGILIHDGSKPSDSSGCILVGDKGADGTLTYNKERMFQIAEIIRVATNNGKKVKIIVTRNGGN